ncbi:unnamed protein product, partial [Ectocarpus sp. 12 AP-2014]
AYVRLERLCHKPHLHLSRERPSCVVFRRCRQNTSRIVLTQVVTIRRGNGKINKYSNTHCNTERQKLWRHKIASLLACFDTRPISERSLLSREEVFSQSFKPFLVPSLFTPALTQQLVEKIQREKTLERCF